MCKRDRPCARSHYSNNRPIRSSIKHYTVQRKSKVEGLPPPRHSFQFKARGLRFGRADGHKRLGKTSLTPIGQLLEPAAGQQPRFPNNLDRSIAAGTSDKGSIKAKSCRLAAMTSREHSTAECKRRTSGAVAAAVKSTSTFSGFIGNASNGLITLSINFVATCV